MLAIFDPLRDLTFPAILFRFCLATACSALIGFERGRKRHEAGLRTHMVVCIGAASVMLLNQYLLVYYNPNADPARLGAQVISGIGFLGAGSIIITGYQRGRRIKGLTTAAGLWACACMGLVVGSGFYEAALCMCVFLFGIISLLKNLEKKYLKNTMVVRIYIEFSREISFSRVVAMLRENRWHLSNCEWMHAGNEMINSVIVEVQRTGLDTDKAAMMSMLCDLEGILFAEET